MSTLLEQASLVMIPSGYKEDTVYSVIPETGAGDLSFTRASNGTRINSAGLVEVMPYNLLSYSEDFTNGLWTKTQITVSANSTTAPDGTNTADTITDVAVLSGHNTSQVAAISSTSLITASCFIKKNVSRYVGVRLFVPTNGVDVGRFSIVVDLETGLITSTLTSGQTIANLSYSVVDSGNGWYRCIISGTSPVGNASLMTWLTPSGTPSNDGFAATSYLGNGQSVFVWGAQLVQGSTAKEYFPTTDRLNVPRLDYSNGSCPSLLLEKQSTNLALWSEDFSNAVWTKQEITISANSTTAPDGTMTADKCIPTTLSSTHQISSSALIASSTCAFGVYAKAGGYNTIHILDRALASNGAIFDLSAGTVTNVGSGVGTITSVGNGWYRCMVVATTTGIRFYIPSTNGAFVGDGTSGVYLWGAQLEQSSYATSYIPTTSASATRVADACSKTGISSLIGQAEGTFMVEANYLYLSSNARVISISDGTSTNLIQFYTAPNSAIIRGYIKLNNTLVFDSDIITPANINFDFKIAIAYKTGNTAIYVNGVSLITSSTAFSTPTLNRFGFNNASGAQAFEGIAKSVYLSLTRLTNSELAQLTAL